MVMSRVSLKAIKQDSLAGRILPIHQPVVFLVYLVMKYELICVWLIFIAVRAINWLRIGVFIDLLHYLSMQGLDVLARMRNLLRIE